MAQYKTTLYLNGNKLRELAKKFDNKSADIEKRAAEVVKRTIEDGYEYLMSVIPRNTGELAESAKKEYVDGATKGILRVDGEHALFVEYGTGVVGMHSPHPEATQVGYEYDVHEHGYDGWVYLHEEYGFVHTIGQIGQQFFYDTKLYMKDRMEYWTKEIFKDFWKGF